MNLVVILTLLALTIHLIGSYLAVKAVRNYYRQILFAFTAFDWVFIVVTSWLYLLVHTIQRRRCD